jgi:hypothetical protein
MRQINLTLSLAFLAPQLVKAAVEGRLPRGINIERSALTGPSNSTTSAYRSIRELNDQNCSFMSIYRNGILPSDLDDISH